MDKSKETKLNEKRYVENFVNFEKNINASQKYIKENFNVDSSYNEDECKMYIWTDNIQEGRNLAAAKEYVNSCIDESMLSIEFGKN